MRAVAELPRPLPPERSLAQRTRALARANEIRSRRARLKRDLKAGRETLVGVLCAPVPSWLETMKVYDLLLAAPKYGRVKAQKILRSVAISPSKTVGGLSERQRGELVGLLRRAHGDPGPVKLRETRR